jgi:hypothetical protein
MKNVSARSSVGATLFAASFDPDARFGTKLRYRQWLGRRVHAEIAPGFLWLNDSFGSRSPGLIAHAAVGYGEWIAFTAQVESARYEFRGRETTAFVGLRAGSYVGAVGHAVGIVVLVVTVIAAGNKT